MKRAHKRMSGIGRRLWILLGVLPLVGAALVGLAVSSASSAPSVVPPTGIVCTEQPGDTTPTFSLKTATGQITTPDGNGVFMWGYTTDPGSFQMPGPVLCVTEGDHVTVSLTNNLAEPVSIVFPGQAGVAATAGGSCPTPDDCLFAVEAAASGGAVTYEFDALEPGTYLYESGTSPQKQVQMGLYGALIVRPALGEEYAYNDPQTRFSEEHLVLLNEIDPDLHHAVEIGQPYNITNRRPGYWHVNGRSFPDTIADNGVPWLPAQPYGALVRVEPFDADDNRYPVLIRYANAGMDNHPFHPHGNHLRVIARDGRLLRGPGGEDTSFEDFTRTIGSGQAYDLLFRWDDVDPWITGGAPVPVTIPNLQNLVFKDDVTFYSGDPRLGEQGELPVGITSFNECGEFYFPWHSHALQEFTNFDEGFGGLATLLRVDPPGGCAP
jgi:FtsP/CotA-like multicopper oxidase with cupredoxin domain